MASRSLSERERRFVVAFVGKAAGVGTHAAELAGYSARSARRSATRLLATPKIQQALASMRERLTRASIADAAERREILTVIARDPEADANARTRAIDVANKMDGLYIERVSVDHRISLLALLVPDATLSPR